MEFAYFCCSYMLFIIEGEFVRHTSLFEYYDSVSL